MALSNPITIRRQAGAGGGDAPSYISSMSPYQVRNLSGTYAPTNGTSSLQSIAPGIWGGNMNIIDPWSGGAKSTSGTKMYVHGGGHADSSNNGIYSFDFAGSGAPTGWAVENQGQAGVTTGTSFPVGSTGQPISVHTYDGMCDMGTAIYRFQGAHYNVNGGLSSQCVRFDKSSKTWTRIPDYPGGAGGGLCIANPAGGKILYMERWNTYFTYAFYRVATTNWSSLKSVGSQWPSDGVAAYNPATNTGLCISGDAAYSIGIDWSAETVSQTSRSLTNMGSGVALIWDATANRYWCFGASNNKTTLYEINPTTFAVTARTLTGNVPLVTDGDYQGTFGRWVFMESWRAIGSVCSETGAAFVIKLP